MKYLKRKYDCFVRFNYDCDDTLVQVFGKREFNKFTSFMSSHYKTGSIRFRSDNIDCRIHCFQNYYGDYQVFGIVCNYTGLDYHDLLKTVLYYFEYHDWTLGEDFYICNEGLMNWHLDRLKNQSK